MSMCTDSSLPDIHSLLLDTYYSSIKTTKTELSNNMFITSDTHFGHKNILKNSSKPLSTLRIFKSTEEMDAHLIANWNDVVGEDDVIIHLGDVSLGSVKDLREIIPQLHGRKILVMGNHDSSKSITKWSKMGWDVVVPDKIVIYNIILSHEPLEVVPPGMVNLHGHTHASNPFTQGKKKAGIRYNVGVDAHNYKPILVSDAVMAAVTDYTIKYGVRL